MKKFKALYESSMWNYIYKKNKTLIKTKTKKKKIKKSKYRTKKKDGQKNEKNGTIFCV